MNENHHEDQYSPLIKNGNATEGAHQTSISFFGPPTLSQLQHLTFLGLRVLSTSLLNTSFKLLIVWCPFFLVTFLEKVPCILSSSSTLVPNLQKRIPGPSSHCHPVREYTLAIDTTRPIRIWTPDNNVSVPCSSAHNSSILCNS